VFEVYVGRCAEGVNSWLSRACKCFGCAFYVLFGGPAERSNFDVTAVSRHRAYRCEVTFGRDWKPGFDDVNAKFLKFFRHADLLAQVHRTPRRLFAVT
jgi:hypothetical protein